MKKPIKPPPAQPKPNKPKEPAPFYSKQISIYPYLVDDYYTDLKNTLPTDMVIDTFLKNIFGDEGSGDDFECSENYWGEDCFGKDGKGYGLNLEKILSDFDKFVEDVAACSGYSSVLPKPTLQQIYDRLVKYHPKADVNKVTFSSYIGDKYSEYRYEQSVVCCDYSYENEDYEKEMEVYRVELEAYEKAYKEWKANEQDRLAKGRKYREDKKKYDRFIKKKFSEFVESGGLEEEK